MEIIKISEDCYETNNNNREETLNHILAEIEEEERITLKDFIDT